MSEDKDFSFLDPLETECLFPKGNEVVFRF